jgi:hypothetical protein
MSLHAVAPSYFFLLIPIVLMLVARNAERALRVSAETQKQP